ncbi:MAG: hypothetical protein WBM13_03095 [Bacteroidia bacterium]
MKNCFFIATLFLLSITYTVNSQTNNYDTRLLSKFSDKELSEMKVNAPATLNYWNFYVANAYQIMDLAAEKALAHEIKGTLKIVDLNNINVFELNKLPLAKDYQYYKIENTNKLLVIISEEQIKAKFNKSSK